MKKWAALLVLSASFTTNVFAETAQNRDKLQYLQFSENELQSVFAKDDKEKMDIVALSQNETKRSSGLESERLSQLQPAVSSLQQLFPP